MGPQFLTDSDRDAAGRMLEDQYSVRFQLALAAYSILAALADLWPVNWIRVVLDMSYRHSVNGVRGMESGLLFYVAMIIAACVVMSTPRFKQFCRERANGQMPQFPPQDDKAPLSDWHKRFLIAWWGAVVIWVVGGSAFVYQSILQASNAHAVYHSVSADAPALAQARYGEHFSVDGKIFGAAQLEYYLGRTLRYADPDHFLLPLVPQDWRAGDPVHLVLNVKSQWDIPRDHSDDGRAEWLVPAPVLGRVITRLPLSIQLALGRLGAPLAPDFRVLELLKSQSGQPVQLPDYRSQTLWICVAFSTFFALINSLQGAYLWNRNRRRTRRRDDAT